MRSNKAGASKARGKTAVLANASEDIKFYRANEKPYGAFSNLFKSVITFEDRLYPTAEHAYQAGKAVKPAVREWILQAPTPALAAMAAHGLYTWDIVPNWANIKIDRMRAVLRAKFTQHPDLRELLLETGARRLVEAGTVNNAVNRFWGEVNGKGENTLGKLLMEIRNELRKEKVNHRSQLKALRNKKQAVQELAA
jgi:hypothetical protein